MTERVENCAAARSLHDTVSAYLIATADNRVENASARKMLQAYHALVATTIDGCSIDNIVTDRGYCYLQIFRREFWMQLIAEFGRFPKLSDLLAKSINMVDVETLFSLSIVVVDDGYAHVFREKHGNFVAMLSAGLSRVDVVTDWRETFCVAGGCCPFGLLDTYVGAEQCNMCGALDDCAHNGLKLRKVENVSGTIAFQCVYIDGMVVYDYVARSDVELAYYNDEGVKVRVPFHVGDIVGLLPQPGHGFKGSMSLVSALESVLVCATCRAFRGGCGCRDIMPGCVEMYVFDTGGKSCAKNRIGCARAVDPVISFREGVSYALTLTRAVTNGGVLALRDVFRSRL